MQRAEPARLLAIAVQLALLTTLAFGFEIETYAFRLVMAMALAGFVVHHALPMAWRLPFFGLLSLASLVLVVQPLGALRLVVVGGLLVGVCHLPIRFGWRLALIGGMAVLLVLGRAMWLPMPGYEALWPILGSMFMFRLMIYLYDLKNGSAPFSFWRSLAYFFMLPNVCFPMYPIVDYQTFTRTYFDEATPWRSYQVGIKWMFRGMIHLLMYRFIVQNLLIGAESVSTAADLAQYMVTTFLLYLQISGQFHIIVGLLHLFGFNLPETHHNYLLSSSFTDFWRRINIYWKDFILKLFFNPVYFRCKRWPPARAMTVATVVAFFFTWLLHSYQWYWIRGTFLLTWQEITFWTALAALVLVNALYEQHYGRSRAIAGKSRSLISRAGLGLRTIGTFCVIVTLWCLWTFPGTFPEWLTFMGAFARIDAQSALYIVLGLAGLGVAGALFGDVAREVSLGRGAKSRGAAAEPAYLFWRTAATMTLLILLVPGVVKFRRALPLSYVTRTMMGDLLRDSSDVARAERDQGYYEDLTNTKSYNQALWELYNRQPGGPVVLISQTAAGRAVPDKFHQVELVPSSQAEFRGATITINRWGMRDREYEKQKPPGTYRIALIGSSISMGWGVGDDETYENVLEDRLNRDFGGKRYERFEVLNFGVPGYVESHQLWSLERALEFQPDLVLWEFNSTAKNGLARHLVNLVKNDVPIPYSVLRDRIAAEGLDSHTGGLVLRSRLQELASDFLDSIWRQAQEECNQRNIRLLLTSVPRADDADYDRKYMEEVAKIAQGIGVSQLDLNDAYREAANRESIAVARGDAHPNALGHRLLADELYRQLLAVPELRAELGAASPTPDVARSNDARDSLNDDPQLRPTSTQE